MKLLSKTKDVQGTRYHYAGAFKFVKEDWEKSRKQLSNNTSIKILIQEIFNKKIGKQNA